jgi:type II secretory pathway predicted ATPase ExeA
MYEQHFGLKRRPFRAMATGTDVFIGPHIVATMAGIKKALSANDAMVTVAGPVGSGKTTLVTRALESVGQNQIIVQVARMRLDSDDVLELLLDKLNVENKPKGTIAKFASFRRRLKELQDNQTRVFIAVEDSVRLGADTLAEIEALTAADAGESEGAGVVLMGDERLATLLDEPQLVRIQQRLRQRLNVVPLCAAELRGYLRHCFRIAGGELEKVFEANAAELLHHLSSGIPRTTNNLVESAMSAAADQNLANVASALLARVAENEYGLSAAGFDLSSPMNQESVATTEPVPEPLSEPVAEPEAVVVIPELPVEEPLIVFADSTAADAIQDSPDELEIPELIQDTWPDLQILAPTLAESPAPIPESEPLPALEDGPEPILEGPTDPRLAVESAANHVPDWERDPTMAELRPDLAALEQAMAFAQGDAAEPRAKENSVPPLAPVIEPEEPEIIPEITLDHAISQRVESNLIDEQGEVSLPTPDSSSLPKSGTETPSTDLPKKPDKQADAELEKIAVELANAKSIEDVDENLVETVTATNRGLK